MNRLLVGAPKSYDPLQPGVKSPGVLFRCPIEGDVTTCTEVIVDTTGESTFYVVYRPVGMTPSNEHDITQTATGFLPNAWIYHLNMIKSF